MERRFYLRHDLQILRLLFFSKIRDLSIPLKARKLSYNINNLKERCFPGRKWTLLWGFQITNARSGDSRGYFFRGAVEI